MQHHKQWGWPIDRLRKQWETGRWIAVDRTGLIVKASSAGEQPRDSHGHSLLSSVVHDLVHNTFQHNIAGFLTDPVAFTQYGAVTEPRWLVEGMATMIHQLLVSDHLGTDYSKLRERYVKGGKALDMQLLEVELYPEHLTDEERNDRSDRSEWIECIHMCGFVAAELLASHVGLSKLPDYFMLLEPWMMPLGLSSERHPRPGWRLAFEQAYEMTIDEFYDLFEEHRAAGFPDPNRPTPTGPQTVDDYIFWKVGDEVNPTAVAEARETVLVVHDYAVDLGLSRLGSPITIFLHRNLDALAAEFEATTGRELENRVGPDFAAGRNPFANGSNWVAVNTSADRYQEWSAETRERQLGVHFSDALLQEMSGLRLWAPADRVPPGGPAWLRKGSEKYITYQALRSTVPESCDPTRSSYARISESEDTPLSEAETSEDFWALENSSAHGFLAVELLAEQADPDAVIAYFAALQPGSNWQEAFHAAFGITIEEFYQRFEERRAAAFPRPRCPTLPPLVTLPGSPEYVKWFIEPDVSTEIAETVVEGTRLMHEYAQSIGMPGIQSEYEVYLYRNLDDLAATHSKLSGSSLQNSRDYWETGFARASVKYWMGNATKFDTDTGGKVAAHELFHLYQSELSGLSRGSQDHEVPKTGPRWLHEGVAEYLAYRAMDAGDALDYEVSVTLTGGWCREPNASTYPCGK